MTTDERNQDRDVLAAEYALRLLTGAELAEAKRLASTDQEFSQAVTGWEVQLATLAEEIPAEIPNPSVKKALLSRLFASPQRVPWWNRLRTWQAVAVSCLLLVSLVALDNFNQQTVDSPLYTAEIATQNGDFRVVAVVDKSTNEVFLTRTAGAPPQGRILQVWAHGEGEPAISVGLWPAGETIRLPMPEQIAAVEGILTLGVSEEPVGGSLTGSPSGRVFGTVDIPDVMNRL
ncbi:MAG: anti-sigma factor [Sulfitobacter sp.]